MASASEYKVFMFEYTHEGRRWSVDIPAVSMDDAKARVRKLAHAKPMGEVVATIPASAGGGFFAPLICWLRNWFYS